VCLGGALAAAEHERDGRAQAGGEGAGVLVELVEREELTAGDGGGGVLTGGADVQDGGRAGGQALGQRRWVVQSGVLLTGCPLEGQGGATARVGVLSAWAART